MEQDKVQKILPVNSRVKDTFFKTVYRSNERLKGLAQFLLGMPDGEVCIKNVRPVVFGSRENDLSFLYDDIIYLMMEEEASICPNIMYPIRWEKTKNMFFRQMCPVRRNCWNY